MKSTNISKNNITAVVIDNSLEQYKSLPILKHKLERTNKVLKVVGVPKLSKK
jgi:hypothetical protein